MAFSKIKIESIIKSRQGRKIKKRKRRDREFHENAHGSQGKDSKCRQKKDRVIGHVQVNTTGPPCRSVQFASHRNETQAQQLRLNVLPEKRARWHRESHTDHFLSPD